MDVRDYRGSREALVSELQSENERRSAVRHSCDGFAEVVVPSTGYLFRGEIIDLSPQGCYIKTRARLNIRRHVPVELRFNVNYDQFSLLAHTAVIDSGRGAAFRFTAMAPEVSKNLLELIHDLSRA